MSKPSHIVELLRDCGFEAVEFPDALRTNPVLLRYACDLPKELRAEFLGALREFFRVYQGLNDAQRAEMLEQFEVQLQEEFARKRRDH